MSEHKQKLGPFDIGMMVLSIVAVINISVLLVMHLPEDVRHYLLIMDTFICVVFLLHFFYNLKQSRDRSSYVKEHWLDFVASIPAVEVFRLARFLQVLRVIRLIKHSRHLLLTTLKDRIQTTLATMMVVLVILIGASGLSIYLIEFDLPDANIRTAEDAIWWSLVTISTVGYGDYYPVSTAGRVVSILLILSGVSLFGVISGYIASYFITPQEKDQLAVQNKRIIKMQQHVEELDESIQSLHSKIDHLLEHNNKKTAE